MKRPAFMQMLKDRWDQNLFLCVGLDPDIDKIPEHLKHGNTAWNLKEFCVKIVNATHMYACAFKINIAFFASEGEEGIRALSDTVKHIREISPEIPVILDAKRADIDNTNKGYVKEAFDVFDADALTLHPYLGYDALRPFLEKKDIGCFILCRTSNKGAGEFQDLETPQGPLYQVVARRVSQHWNVNGNCGLVVGATYPDELASVRNIVGDMPILIPGIGAQGGDLEKSVLYGMNSQQQGILINASRGIIYANPTHLFEQAAHEEAKKLHDAINSYR